MKEWGIYVALIAGVASIIMTMQQVGRILGRGLDELREKIDTLKKKVEEIEGALKANQPSEELSLVSEETVRNWKDGAERGDPESQFSFGLHQSVAGFKTEALSWYRKAAEQGHAYAQHYLGMAYANYDGVPQNHAEAYFWLSLSATCWGKAKENRDEIGKRISDTERTKIDKRCQDWIGNHPKIFC